MTWSFKFIHLHFEWRQQLGKSLNCFQTQQVSLGTGSTVQVSTNFLTCCSALHNQMYPYPHNISHYNELYICTAHMMILSIINYDLPVILFFLHMFYWTVACLTHGVINWDKVHFTLNQLWLHTVTQDTVFWLAMYTFIHMRQKGTSCMSKKTQTIHVSEEKCYRGSSTKWIQISCCYRSNTGTICVLEEKGIWIACQRKGCVS